MRLWEWLEPSLVPASPCRHWSCCCCTAWPALSVATMIQTIYINISSYQLSSPWVHHHDTTNWIQNCFFFYKKHVSCPWSAGEADWLDTTKLITADNCLEEWMQTTPPADCWLESVWDTHPLLATTSAYFLTKLKYLNFLISKLLKYLFTQMVNFGHVFLFYFHKNSELQFLVVWEDILISTGVCHHWLFLSSQCTTVQPHNLSLHTGITDLTTLHQSSVSALSENIISLQTQFAAVFQSQQTH